MKNVKRLTAVIISAIVIMIMAMPLCNATVLPEAPALADDEIVVISVEDAEIFDTADANEATDIIEDEAVAEASEADAEVTESKATTMTFSQFIAMLFEVIFGVK